MDLHMCSVQVSVCPSSSLSTRTEGQLRMHCQAVYTQNSLSQTWPIGCVVVRWAGGGGGTAWKFNPFISIPSSKPLMSSGSWLTLPNYEIIIYQQLITTP
jgi:hypothetical protein